MAPCSETRILPPEPPAPEPGNRALQVAIWVAALVACIAAFDLARNAVRLSSPPQPEEVAEAARNTAAPRATRVARFGTDNKDFRKRAVFDSNAVSPFIDPSEPRPRSRAALSESPPATPALDRNTVLQEMHMAGGLQQISDHQATMLSDAYWQSDGADPDSGTNLSLEEIERLRREGLIVR